MIKFTKYSKRVTLASAVSLVAIACSPINAQSNLQDASAPEDEKEVEFVEKKGVKIIKRGDHKWVSKDGVQKFKVIHAGGDKGKHKSVDVRVMVVGDEGGEKHKIKVIKEMIDGKVKIDVEGGELTKDSDGNDIVKYVDNAGKEHTFKLDDKSHGNFVFAGSGNKHVIHKKGSAPKVWFNKEGTQGHANAPHARQMRIEFQKANDEISRAKVELQASLVEVEKELAEIKDIESAEYEGLKIAKSAIKSALESLGDNYFDEEKIEFEIAKMDKDIIFHLENAMEDVHQQRKVIIDLQGDIEFEVEGVREEMRDMLIEIEEMNEGDHKVIRLKAVKEMEAAMGDMAEVRLKALKEAEKELKQARIELEKEIAELKARKDETGKAADKKDGK